MSQEHQIKESGWALYSMLVLAVVGGMSMLFPPSRYIPVTPEHESEIERLSTESHRRDLSQRQRLRYVEYQVYMLAQLVAQCPECREQIQRLDLAMLPSKPFGNPRELEEQEASFTKEYTWRMHNHDNQRYRSEFGYKPLDGHFRREWNQLTRLQSTRADAPSPARRN